MPGFLIGSLCVCVCVCVCVCMCVCVIHARVSNVCICMLIPKPINGVHYKETNKQAYSSNFFLPKVSDGEYFPMLTSSKHSCHTVAYYNMVVQC